MTSVVDTSVKHAYSRMTGASAISATAGALLGALRAFLVTGWGLKSVDSAVISNGICRLSFASGKSAAEIHSVIILAGASPAVLNGEQRITAVASSWVEFKTDLPDGPVTGAINFKMSPLGFEEVFPGTTTKAVFRSKDVSGTRAFFRIDDSDPTAARVQMYESMTDIDTGIAVSPLAVAGGYYWSKGPAAGSTPRNWLMIGDSRGFYFVNTPYNDSNITAVTCGGYGLVARYFGDIKSHRSGDAWCGFLSGASVDIWNSSQGCVFQDDSSAGSSLQRASTGLGAGQQTSRNVLGGGISGYQGPFGAFPARANNGLHLSEIPVADAGWSSGPRGWMPGAYHCLQSSVAAALGFDIRFTEGQGEFLGKQLLSVSIGTPSSTNNGLAFFDATDPWRVE